MKTETFTGTKDCTLRDYKDWFQTKRFETVEVLMAQSYGEYSGTILTIIVVYVEKR